MDGIFPRKKFSLWNTLLLLSSVALIGLYIFITVVDPQSKLNGIPILIFALFTLVIFILSHFFNRGAYLRIHNGTVTGKYHLFGRIECSFSDIDFVSASANNLSVLLKNGKLHTIAYLLNSCELADMLRRNVPFEVTEPPERLLVELHYMKAERRRWIIYVILSYALMCLNIFIAVLLTDGKEFSEFGSSDITVMAIMGVLELVTVVLTFYFAQKCGKYVHLLKKQEYTVRRRSIETTPLPYDSPIKVCTDVDFTFRTAVFPIAESDSVRYTLECFSDEIQLYKIETYRIDENIDELFKNLDDFIDITEKYS